MFAPEDHDFEMSSRHSYCKEMVVGTREVVILLDVIL